MKAEREVILRVYSRAKSTDPGHLKQKMSGVGTTVKLGKYIHVVAVTAKPISNGDDLVPGEIYFYDLIFPECYPGPVPDETNCLKIPGIVDVEGTPFSKLTKLYYPETSYEQLPSFSLPPDDINKLRIVHGSCRKAHNEGLDAMPAIDDMIAKDWPVADERPHMLLLTGDQIYADDIAASMLYILMDADKTLLDWTEAVPDATIEGLEPGKRVRLIKHVANFTSLDTKNHLVRWGEFCAMYLYNWSDVLWPESLPTFDQVIPYKYPITVRQSSFKKENSRLEEFRKALPAVRRALANVPTYMIFDDHDVTDDWYMTKKWCEDVLEAPLGRRIVQNALLAYAIFQAWGNTPDQFRRANPGESEPAGRILLQAAAAWSKLKGTSAVDEQEIAKHLGLPDKNNLFTRDLENGLFILAADSDALKWHFALTLKNVEIIFLDIRTRRAFRDKPDKPPTMLGLTALEEQIPQGTSPKLVTIVVSPTPVIKIPVLHPEGLPWIASYVMRRDLKKHGITYYDIFDHWMNQDELFETFLAMMASRWKKFSQLTSRVVILTGDIHFAAISRLQYQSDTLYKADLEDNDTFKRYRAIFAQLCSSAFKKQSKETRFVHHHGYKFGNTAAFLAFLFPSTLEWTEYFNRKLPESSQWFGWRKPIGLGGSAKGPSTYFENHQPPKWMASRSPALVKVGNVGDGSVPPPHWRYRIDYILAENDAREPAPIAPEDFSTPSPGDHQKALQAYLSLASNHKEYARKWGNGKELAGLNNVAEVSFEWTDSKKSVIQSTWWRLKSKSNDEKFLKAFPLSRFIVSFEFEDPDYEMPHYKGDS
ncbi:MAG: hypothetical protein R3293_15945 [Candidatus Promineifilaceae bacterium]|nr:hypothetical protein [Candidatus Promineifilaceae bacterium]